MGKDKRFLLPVAGRLMLTQGDSASDFRGEDLIADIAKGVSN